MSFGLENYLGIDVQFKICSWDKYLWVGQLLYAYLKAPML